MGSCLWRRLETLAQEVMKEEIEARLVAKKALSQSDLKWTATIMHDILLSNDRILLESVMLGNLSLDKRTTTSLRLYFSVSGSN